MPLLRCLYFFMAQNPTSEDTLCKFAAFLASKKIKHQTIKCYLSGIRFQHIIRHLSDPFLKDMPRLQYVLRGIKKDRSIHPQQSQYKRLPVSPTILLQVHSVLTSSPCTHDTLMLWAAALLCFYGFLRSGEITIPSANAYDPTVHLNFTDLSFDAPVNPSIIRVNLKASKTDPFRVGVQIYIGKTTGPLCPIAAMLAYLAVRGSVHGLLFHHADGSPLTKAKFVSGFRSKLSQAGLDSKNYSGHSFRIGAATTAAANGVEDSLIQTLGRWKSNAYLSYVKMDPQYLAALSSRLCQKS